MISYTLEKDEYIIELKGKKGCIIDSFGILTNKGNFYNFGGEGGE